jgi:hypothetical protein
LLKMSGSIPLKKNKKLLFCRSFLFKAILIS